MKIYAVLALAALALSACGHAKDEAQKASEETELRSTKWVSNCDTSGVIWATAGVKSSNTVYDFQNGDAGKTIQFFGAPDCNQSTLIAQATFKGTQDIGGVAANGSARTLDLNYQQAIVTVSSQDLVNALNSAFVPSCGINDWKVGQGRDVTSASGGANCMIIPKTPAMSYDVVHTDGQQMQLGLKDVAHDATTQEKRPVQLDNVNGYHKL
jgi:hypothetical protein